MSLLSKTKDLFRRNEKPHSANSARGKKAGTQQKSQKVTEPEKISVQVSDAAAQIDLASLTTEKGMLLAAQTQTAVFWVRKSATKHQIARAVAAQYKVKPLAIRTVHMRPKRRIRGREVGFTSEWKKAYVKVDDIQKLHVTP